jgi:hypothetical protein
LVFWKWGLVTLGGMAEDAKRQNKTGNALWVARLVLFTWCLIWFTWFRCGCHGAHAFQVSQLFCCFFTVSMFYTWSTVLLHCLYECFGER